jgi:hypothetical protein
MWKIDGKLPRRIKNPEKVLVISNQTRGSMMSDNGGSRIGIIGKRLLKILVILKQFFLQLV